MPQFKSQEEEKDMRIHFETPLHGWMRVNFEDGEQIFSLTASDILINSVNDFAQAMLSFIDWGEGRGRFYTEPTTYEFVLRRDGKTVTFEIFELLDFNSFIEHGTLIFRVENVPHIFLLHTWRALRHLESRLDHEHWRENFPTKAVERLGTIVKKK